LVAPRLVSTTIPGLCACSARGMLCVTGVSCCDLYQVSPPLCEVHVGKALNVGDIRTQVNSGLAIVTIVKPSFTHYYHTSILPQVPPSASPAMSTNGASDDGMEILMIPWLHFEGGDNLFFKSIHPSSGGAIAGACFVLIALAIFERWVSGMRGNMEGYWRQRTLAIIANRSSSASAQIHEATYLAKDDKEADDIAEVDANSLSSKRTPQDFATRPSRVLPPFIASHDFPRGLAYSLQALLTYLLMLAVMTFQAAYFIAIVVGLGIGEMLFGRLGSTHFH